MFELTPPLSSSTAAGAPLIFHLEMLTLMFRPHKYEGGHQAQDLADFVEDILRPVVVTLTVSDYYLPSDILIHTVLPPGQEFPPESWCKG